MSMSPTDFQVLIPILVPLLLTLARTGITKIPRRLLPFLAPVLGGLLDALGAYLTGQVANPLVGAVWGSAGVGLREMVNQARKAAIGPPAAG